MGEAPLRRHDATKVPDEAIESTPETVKGAMRSGPPSPKKHMKPHVTGQVPRVSGRSIPTECRFELNDDKAYEVYQAGVTKTLGSRIQVAHDGWWDDLSEEPGGEAAKIKTPPLPVPLTNIQPCKLSEKGFSATGTNSGLEKIYQHIQNYRKLSQHGQLYIFPIGLFWIDCSFVYSPEVDFETTHRLIPRRPAWFCSFHFWPVEGEKTQNHLGGWSTELP